jgi:hypothetical protein
MRIAVVLPAPLGPMNPNLPLTDRERHVVKSKDVAIAACQPS